VSELVEALAARFEAVRDPAAAERMARYMRDRYPFLGINSPARRSIQREAMKETGVDREELLRTAEELWRHPEREYQYAACDLLIARVRLLEPSDLGQLHRFITTKSWWDTVDALAIHVVGPLVLSDRTAGDPVIDSWISSDDVWVARAAILHQNRWKERTDEERLFDFCRRRAGDTDFFLRKAIGWALREYSKTSPRSVRAFITANDDVLSGLSKREGLKRLDR
jgi:3-methyladenine DNA glycosylase AlkD